MPFNFSFSSSATFVSASSANGESKGWAYRREAYSNNDGSGVRTFRQNLGEAPSVQTRIYDSRGKPLLAEGSNNSSSSGNGRRRGTQTPTRRIISIEDVTEEEERKAANAQKKSGNTH